MLNAFFLKSKLLRMSGILLVILSFCIPAFSASLEALGIEQKKVTVNGVVLDDTREPLIGVSVLVKGSQQGTVTDLDGKYSITAPADGILVFSFVGMEKQEIKIVDFQREINVVMREKAGELEEVVITGYGETTKRKAAGSVAVLTKDAFENKIPTSVDDILQGLVAGVAVMSYFNKMTNRKQIRSIIHRCIHVRYGKCDS